MNITFYGAARTVTGSQHLIEANGYRILLDCGLFQGKRKEAFELNRQGFCDAGSVDLLILSHAHIDHSGKIPCFVKNGFQGDIYCTSATRDLCAIMLMDSAHIQEKDVEFVNKRREKQGKNLFEPLYVQEDVVNAMEHFISMDYNHKRQIAPGMRLTLIDAGHMLGSATVILDIADHDTGREVRLAFSGDVGRPGIPIIRDPEPVTEGADILIVESTYGNRLHQPYEENEEHLTRVINDTYNRRGVVLIPAFAVGRTQHIVYSLHQLFNKQMIPDIPIYVDSPLATMATDVLRLHPETYDEEIRAFLLHNNINDPFGFSTLHYTRSVEESKALNDLQEPAVIISASGMMEAGRILHHLRHRISDSKDTILITGWQAPNTLGRKIMERQSLVKIFGEEFALRAQVEVLNGFSGHADREGLLNWVKAMKKKPHHTFVVHGEEESAKALAEGLRSECGFKNIDIPDMRQRFSV